MASGNLVTESREVPHFDRVVLRASNMANELVIRQGEHESLDIEARQGILSRIETEVRDRRLMIKVGGGWSDKLRDALRTSLTRPRVRYRLTVKALTGLDVCGFVRVSIANLAIDRLALRFCGVGDVHVESLTAELLEVDLSGAGGVNLAGQVAEQRVAMSGPGHYDAPNLESRRAQIKLNGIGQATVWAVENLDVTILGLGSVEYYGAPQVKKHGSPMASVARLGSR